MRAWEYFHRNVNVITAKAKNAKHNTEGVLASLTIREVPVKIPHVDKSHVPSPGTQGNDKACDTRSIGVNHDRTAGPVRVLSLAVSRPIFLPDLVSTRICPLNSLSPPGFYNPFLFVT